MQCMAFLMLSPINTITKRDFSPISYSRNHIKLFSLAFGIDVKYISIEMIKDKFICFINSFKIKTIFMASVREAKLTKEKK